MRTTGQLLRVVGRAALLAAVTVVWTGTARAATIQFVDTYTPAGSPVEFDQGTSLDYFHDIAPPTASTNSLETFIDGALTPGAGYDSTTDLLSSGVLSLYFNVAAANGTQKYSLFLDGSATDFGADDIAGGLTTVHIGTALFQVNWITTTGLLSVDLTRTNNAGDVYFIKSVLDVSGARTIVVDDETDIGGDSAPPVATPVPEPGTLLLIGSGLAALAARRRRARQSKT